MANKQDTQQAYALLDYYLKLYAGKYGKTLTINRHREKWAMIDVIQSVGGARAKELLDYYFTTSKVGHPLTWFYYNFDRLDALEAEVQKDRKKREALLKQTEETVKRYRKERLGEQRSETDFSSMSE